MPGVETEDREGTAEMRRLARLSVAALVGFAIGSLLWALTRTAVDTEQELRRVTAEIVDEASTHDDTVIVHKWEADCPEGWREEEGIFTQADGSSWPACVRPGSTWGSRMDFLDAGEGVSVPFGVVMP
jgi:hypothetical protein